MDYDKVTDLDTQELTIVKKKKKQIPLPPHLLKVYRNSKRRQHNYSFLCVLSSICKLLVGFFRLWNKPIRFTLPNERKIKKKHLMQLCCLIQCYRTEINSPTNFISIHDQSEMFHFDFRPMRDVLFRLATNEMCFISIHDQ